jgi:putative sigma-54 modulation protein
LGRLAFRACEDRIVQIKIAVRHGHLNEAVQQSIREKAEKLLHFFERLTLIEITVDLAATFEHKDVKMVEFVVQAEHKHDIIAREHHTELMVAVDMAMDKLEAQLRRYKQKVQDHRRTPSAGQVAGVPEAEEPTDE